MTPEPRAESPDAPPGRRKRAFSTTVTVLSSIAALLYLGLLGRPLIEPGVSPIAELEYPEQSLERLVTRELDLRAAMLRGGLPWEWRLYRALYGDEDPLLEAGDWYAELLEQRDSPVAQMERLVVLAEAGRTDAVREDIADWHGRGGDSRRFPEWVTAAYLGAPPSAAAGHRLIAEVERDLPSNWFSDTLVRRIAARIGDTEARARAESAIATRGHRLLVRARTLTAVAIALIVVGGGAMGWLRARRGRVRVAHAALPPMWSGADGYALFVRALGVPQAIALVGFIVLRRETGLGSAFGMAADLPIFLWLGHYLRSHASSMRAAFGLVPDPGGYRPLVATTLALIALALLSDTAIQLASGYLNIDTHWTDSFSEDMIWSDRRRVVLGSIDAALWAPIVEEITFRGVLYGALRARFGVGTSALVSAVIFTLPHGYAVAGSVSVLVSGLLWAYAYELTGSLLPGLLAHSVNNALSTLWALALLR